MPTVNGVRAEIGLCLLFSAVDGDISMRELGALSSRLGVLLGDDADPLALPDLIEGEMRRIERGGVDAFVAELPKRIAPERRFEAVLAACVVAAADGLAPEEHDVLREVCGVLGVEAGEILARVATR
jgi:uncharacterized tellurite resistance protein B-like protein